MGPRRSWRPCIKTTETSLLPDETVQPSSVKLRPYPYPFRAGLAISSDIDGTRTLERFLAIQRFLNTSEHTCVGPGIGLEIANSFFPYAPDDSFSYFSSRPEEKYTIQTLIQAGLIDTIHSFGDGVDTRAEAARILESLDKSGCKLDVWVNHSQAPSNFGDGTAPGLGDVRESSSYHADLTLEYGIRYVWLGAGTSLLGNNIPHNLRLFANIVDQRHLARTSQLVARQIAKIGAGRLGSPRAQLHRKNTLMHVTKLRDDQPIFEFLRTNNYWDGLAKGHDSFGLAYVLRTDALDGLINSGGASIIYTHIGKGFQEPPYISGDTVKALQGLAGKYRDGELYVTTVSRLLNYISCHKYLEWSCEEDGDNVRINIETVNDPLRGRWIPTAADLQGLCFYSDCPERTQIFIGSERVTGLVKSPADETGRCSVMIPRSYLSFPDIP